MATVTFDKATRLFPGSEKPAVDKLDIEIGDGEFLVLVGPSGCGKSTSLRMLAGLEDVNEGRILIGERDVTNLAPKDRDIAMVFQNYALYPHMTVAENMGFALKIAGESKEKIRERVVEAAKILDLEEYLERKPKALSGGQRQRVAMGRAIVRSPQVFLMDEPLSNLDAKLRVQTRSQIAALQRRLGVTTVYVTHDQIEAMTMGDRVAVIRKGVLQQVDTPQFLYDHPNNLFVAGFIGSPSMNLVEADLERSNGTATVSFGGFRLAIPDEVFAEHPDLRTFEGRRVILGMRPEDMEDAQLLSDAPSDRRISSEVLLREALGADVLAHIRVRAPAVMTEDVRELAHDVGQEALEAVEQRVAAGESTFIARLNPRTGAKAGQEIELVVDVHRLHFFDPETGLGIYGDASS